VGPASTHTQYFGGTFVDDEDEVLNSVSMANLATITHGFCSPGSEECQKIMASVQANAASSSRAAYRRHVTHRTFVDGRQVVEIHPTNAREIVLVYHNPNNSNGLRSVPHPEPATVFGNRGQEIMNILYTSDGKTCSGAQTSDLLATSSLDTLSTLPTIEQPVLTKSLQVSSRQHILHPPKAYVYYDILS
jgi:hypothetical protein